MNVDQQDEQDMADQRMIVDVWFELRDEMMIEGKTPSGARPPSLRDACYAWVLANRTNTKVDPLLIESYVNGLELGAGGALRAAWDKR